LLVAVAVLAGCDGTDVVGVDGERPTRHQEEGVMMPMCSALYRVDGTHDPASTNYDPGVADTALMHIPHTFAWSGRDPYGLCDPLLFRHSLDGGAFSAWASDTSLILGGLTDGPHGLTVLPGCPAVTGIGKSFGFVVNFDPDSKIVEPPDESWTLTVPDGDTLWVRVVAHDREELEGVGGGIAQVVIAMGGQELIFTPPDEAEWWWNSNADPESGHYIESRNSPQGGNAPHAIGAYACDVDGRWEPLNSADTFTFWYNFPPTAAIIFPSEGETVGSDFTILWEGDDPDGDVVTFQYVLDPWDNAYSSTEQSEMSYAGISSGLHEFRLRAQDGSGCWSTMWSIVSFYVE